MLRRRVLDFCLVVDSLIENVITLKSDTGFSCPRVGMFLVRTTGLVALKQITQDATSLAIAREAITCNFCGSSITNIACSVFLQFLILQRSFLCLAPNGWTQAEIVALCMNEIKMYERTAVDIAKTVFLQHFIMHRRTIALMLFESIQRILFGKNPPYVGRG